MTVKPEDNTSESSIEEAKVNTDVTMTVASDLQSGGADDKRPGRRISAVLEVGKSSPSKLFTLGWATIMFVNLKRVALMIHSGNKVSECVCSSVTDSELWVQ